MAASAKLIERREAHAAAMEARKARITSIRQTAKQISNSFSTNAKKRKAHAAAIEARKARITSIRRKAKQTSNSLSTNSMDALPFTTSKMEDTPAMSDDIDRRLFRLLDNEAVDDILGVAHDDPRQTTLHLQFVLQLSSRGLDEAAMKRLGRIIAESTHLDRLSLSDILFRHAEELFDGLQFNRSIKDVMICCADLGGTRFDCFAPFLRFNPNLRDIALMRCNIDSNAIDLLSDALLKRSNDTIEDLDLSYNGLGDVDLDKLVLAVKRSKSLIWLGLSHTGIGHWSCASLAILLTCPHSKLVDLKLRGNAFNDTDMSILMDSLAKNTTLTRLDLTGNSGITVAGWSKALKLVCNSSSIGGVVQCNHTLQGLGVEFTAWPGNAEEVVRALSTDDANLLRASLDKNRYIQKAGVIRRKILWSHARGDLNIGEDSDVATGALPRILEWIGDDSNETNAKLIQYHEPPLPKARMDVIRLDSFYRIVQARPADLCSRELCPKGRGTKRKRHDS